MGKYTLFILLIFLLPLQAFSRVHCSPSLLKKLVGTLSSTTALHPHDAANLLMNLFYQDCNASKAPPYDLFRNGEMRGYILKKHPFNRGSASKVVNRKRAQKSQYYIRCNEKRKKRGCYDLCKNPPTYIWGAKGLYRETGGESLNLFQNERSIQKIAGHPGLDCSGYLNAIFAISGLKVRTDMSNLETARETPAEWFMSESDCFSSVPLKGFKIKPGDVIAWKKHVVMVDSQTKDPFNLSEIDSIDKCKSSHLDPLKFKLIVSNSLGGINDVNKDKRFNKEDIHKRFRSKIKSKNITGIGVGVSKVPFGQLSLKYPVEIMELAKVACFAKFNKKLPRIKNRINIVRHVLADHKPFPEQHKCLQLPNKRLDLKGIKCLEENC